VSANVAVIYSAAELRDVAVAFGKGAEHMSAQVRLLRVPEADERESAQRDPDATLEDLEWADGIAFGTPIGDGRPPDALMRFIRLTEPLWSGDKLFDKVVTMFTDEPEHADPKSILHPIYEALYDWGAVIVGPRAFELAYDAYPRDQDPGAEGDLTGPRQRTAQYRARRLTALADALVAERGRRVRLEL
jgi:NAD(P)H dehydrogenase (quinone)